MADLLRDANGLVVPQYYERKINKYVPISIRNVDNINVSDTYLNLDNTGKPFEFQYLDKDGSWVVYRTSNLPQGVSTYPNIVSKVVVERINTSVVGEPGEKGDQGPPGPQPPLVNSLTSSSTVEALTAAKGKELNEKFLAINSKLLDTTSQVKKDIFADLRQRGDTLNIIAGVDSLTAGTGQGEEYSKWLNYFKEQLYTVYGYGGAGYVSFSNDTSVYESDLLSMGLYGLDNVESITNYSDPKIVNSFDNKGIYSNNANNASADIQIKNKWVNGKIFYLKQPNGGTFDIGYLNDIATMESVNTSNAEYTIGVHELPENSAEKNGQIAIRNAFGNVAIFGGMFTNTEGVTISRLGKGGDTLYTHANKNYSSFSSFLSIISPDLLLMNAGTNDDLTDSEFTSYYTNYIGLFKNFGSEVIAILPHVMFGQPKWKYSEPLIELCYNSKVSLLDMSFVLGDSYEDALSKGNIKDDGIHQTDIGNRLYANKILTFLNIPVIAKKVNKAFSTDVGSIEGANYFVDFENKELSTHGINSSSALAYDIGLRQQYNGSITSGFIDIEIHSATVNMSEISYKKYTFPIYNSLSEENKAYVPLDKVAETVLVPNNSLDVGITLSSNSGRVQVAVSLNSGYGDWVVHRVRAKYTGIFQFSGHNGSAVIEN